VKRGNLGKKRKKKKREKERGWDRLPPLMAALVDITYGVGVGFGQGRRQVAEQGLAMVIRPLKQPWRIYGKR
jgi:hypothetical protein